MAQVGDTFHFDATGDFAPYIECVVVEIHPDDGRPIKIKVLKRDERLGRLGFILEGEDYYAVEWSWSLS